MPHSTRRHLVLLALLGAMGSATALRGQPVGKEFQISTGSSGHQYEPSIDADADGDFVVVWSAYGYSATSARSVHGRRVGAGGQPRGSSFQINTTASSRARVAVEPDGDFVVVWVSHGEDASDLSLTARRYASNGSPRGNDFQVAVRTASYQMYPAVAANATGDFVVAWSSNGSNGDDSSSRSIQARRFASDGSPRGDDFQVNTWTTGLQVHPAVAIDAHGDFVVVWHSYGSAGTDQSSSSIQGQHYASDGTPRGGEYQVNSYTFSWQQFPSVAALTNGDFVVAWESYKSPGNHFGTSVLARRFAADGSPRDVDVQVHSDVIRPSGYRPDKHRPTVDSDKDGRFAIAWSAARDTQGSFPEAVEFRRFASDGTPVAPEVTTTVQSYRLSRGPALAVAPSGGALLGWGSRIGPSGWPGILGRRYAPGAMSISDATVLEGDEGSVSAVFTVSLASARAASVTVDWATGGSGTAAPGGDYIAASGTLTFASGELSKSFEITVQGDRHVEWGGSLGLPRPETFFVNLSNVSGGPFEDRQGRGAIVDDDE